MTCHVYHSMVSLPAKKKKMKRGRTPKDCMRLLYSACVRDGVLLEWAGICF